MCTASWLRSSSGRLDFFFNRDELRSREPALPPRAGSAHGVRYLAPVDGRAGGTWLAATERGLILALLNHSGGRRGPTATASRGELPPILAAAADPESLLATLGALELPRYPPFTLAALWRDPAVGLTAAWDGDAVASAPLPVEVGILCSSGLGDEAARRSREATWRRLRDEAAASGELWNAHHHRALHRSHDPAAGPFSVCMHREEAATVSSAEVSVTAVSVELTYRPGSACDPGEAVHLRLPALAPAAR